MNYPTFGCLGGVQEVVNSGNADRITLNDGLDMIQFLKSHTDPVEKTKRIKSAAGIAKSTAGVDRNSLAAYMTSVSYTREEIVSDVIYSPTEKFRAVGGTAPDLTDKLCYADGLLILRIHETMTLEGKGALPLVLAASLKGTTLTGTTATLTPATDATLILSLADPVYLDYETRGRDTEFTTWRVSLEKYTGNDAPTENMIDVGGADTDLDQFSLITNADITSVYSKRSVTISLSEGDQFATRTERIELYDDEDVAVA